MNVAVHELATVDDAAIAALAEVLLDCVTGGASVGFLLPMTPAKAEAFWRRIAGAVARGERRVFVATGDRGRILGTVSLVLDTPENQPHRAEIAKMLVHRDARRLGLGGRLLTAAEHAARAAGRTVLVLDTVTGSDADRLYVRHGWQRVGEIPRYALFPDGRECATTYFTKQLDRPGA